jgi:hypothetical protein
MLAGRLGVGMLAERTGAALIAGRIAGVGLVDRGSQVSKQWATSGLLLDSLVRSLVWR